MRKRTLTMLLAFVLMPVFAFACAGGDTESADDADAADGEAMEADGDAMEAEGDAMEAEGDAMEEGGEPGHGEEGHEMEGDEMPDTAAAPDTSGTR
jgi:hypothetical protein